MLWKPSTKNLFPPTKRGPPTSPRSSSSQKNRRKKHFCFPCSWTSERRTPRRLRQLQRSQASKFFSSFFNFSFLITSLEVLKCRLTCTCFIIYPSIVCVVASCMNALSTSSVNVMNGSLSGLKVFLFLNSFFVAFFPFLFYFLMMLVITWITWKTR